MSDEYTQDLDISRVPPEIEICKNGIPMSLDDIQDDFEVLQDKIKQLEDGKKRALVIIREMRDVYKSHTPILFKYLSDLEKALEGK